MKKALSMVLAVLLILSLAACGGSGQSAGTGEPSNDQNVSDTPAAPPAGTNTPSDGGSGSGTQTTPPAGTNTPSDGQSGSGTQTTPPADADTPPANPSLPGTPVVVAPGATNTPSGGGSGSGTQESKPADTNTPSGGQSGSGAVGSKPTETKPADTTAPSGGGSASDAPAAGSGSGVKSALDLLTQVWNGYKDDDKFPVIGGGPEGDDMVDGAPGVFAIGDADTVDSRLAFPAASIGKIDEAASLMHMINGNTFTCGAYRVTSAGDVDGVCSAIRDNVKQRHWMCGFPEKIVIVKVDNYVVSFFGAGDLTNAFKAQLTAAYGAAEVYCDDPVMG